MSEKFGVMVCGHGSRDVEAIGEFEAVARGIRERLPQYDVESGFLEFAQPVIREAVERAGDRIAAEETLLVVVGRGASDPDANSNVAKVMRMLWEGFGFGWGETAYSGVTFPLVAPALEHAAKLGYRRIVVFPYFLFTGILVKRIYAHTDLVAERYPEIEFVKAPYLNDHTLVLDSFAERPMTLW